MTEPCPSRVSASKRRLIAMVDQGVYLERLHSKKKARAGYAPNVTAKIRDITEMLGDDQNLQTVKDKLVHAVIAFDKFKEAHFDYWSEVRGTGHMEECCNYLMKHISNFDTFRDRVSGWIARAEHRLLVSAFDFDSEVKPEDSVSQLDSQVRSGSLKYSSCLSSRTSWVASVEAGRFAVLEAEKAMLEERKFRFSQEEVHLNLDVEIAKSAAKGQALAGIFRSPDQPLVHPSCQEPECMIEEGVSPTVARQLNYPESSGKVADTRSQINANHKSVARVATGPPVAYTNFSIDPDYLQLEAVTLQ